MSRYVVTTIEGDIAPRGSGGSQGRGLSAHVIDTLWNRKIVGTFRSEDTRYVRTAFAREEAVRYARERADRLNAAHEREVSQATSGTAR